MDLDSVRLTKKEDVFRSGGDYIGLVSMVIARFTKHSGNVMFVKC